ncbi:MAG: YraN family protein [Sulfuricurvum sp.]
MKNTREKGLAAEERGCEFLRKEGLRILDRNVYNRFGEIDIIAMQGETLRFIEVKSAQSYDQAVYNLSPVKLQKLVRTIQAYLQHKKLTLDYCIDALIVTPEGVEWIENITL